MIIASGGEISLATHSLFLRIQGIVNQLNYKTFKKIKIKIKNHINKFSFAISTKIFLLQAYKLLIRDESLLVYK
jgi:hypothetical protein